MINKLCAFCKLRPATQYHHKFSQSVVNVKIYGRKLIDDPFNRVPACSHCNASHANVETWNENQFRGAAEKAG